MPARLRYLRHRELDGLERGRLTHMQERLNTGIIANANVDEYVFTADNLTNQITVTGQDALAANNPRVFLTGTLPAELESGVIYYLADAGVDLYTLHTNLVDAQTPANPIAFTDDGTGTLTMYIID